MAASIAMNWIRPGNQRIDAAKACSMSIANIDAARSLMA
jgi:hypothetical protein